PGRGESHEQGHRAWYAYSAGCQLSPPGGLGSDHPTLDLINKAMFICGIVFPISDICEHVLFSHIN
ncbi:hypothetical protein V5066_25130, partial [Escherichia coli]|uniref:hypothetical protein n=1 Tax=Escherichia coli TaxID=562 RepID=UPI003076245F